MQNLKTSDHFKANNPTVSEIPVKPKLPKFFYSDYGKVIATAILMFLVFLIAALMVIQAEKYKQKNQYSQPTSSPTLAPTITGNCQPGFIKICEGGDCECIQDDLSNWKTYRNEEYGFEIKYPSDWFNFVNQPKMVAFTTTDPNLGGNLQGIWISRYTNSDNLSLIEFWRTQFEGGNKSYIDDLESNYLETVFVNNLKALRENPDSAPEDQETTRVFVMKDPYVFEIRNIALAGNEVEKTIFNQILSTFKFLDEEREIVFQTLPEGIQTDCDLDSDCQDILSHNTCELYCVNTNGINQTMINSLSKTCDSTLWDPSLSLNCGCVNSSCQLYE